MTVKFREELFPKKEEIFSWICDLSQWGHRKTGTEEGKKSAEYIAEKFREFGLDEIKIEEVPAVFLNTKLCRLNIDGADIECFAGNGTNRRAETGVFEFGTDEAAQQFVYIGEGSEDDIEGMDIAGKIAVSDMRFPEVSAEMFMELFDGAEVYDPEGKLSKPLKKYNIFSPGTWPFNYLNAMKAGAAGFVGILDDYYDDPYWYNEDYTDIMFSEGEGYTALPAVWISRSSGNMLREKFKKAQALEGSMKVCSDYNFRTARNVSGKLSGKSDEIILTHSHHDAVFTGSVQDGSGISEMLALAKYFSQLPEEEREKTMMFAATDTHYANYAGHEEFIRTRHKNGEKLILDLCIEHVGKETAFDENYNEYETGEVEARLVYVSNQSGLYDIVKEKYEKYGLDKTLFVKTDVGNGIDEEEYEFSDSEVISDAYCFNEDGIPIVSMVSAEMYIYHTSDKPDRIPLDQLEPVGKAYAEIALAAAAGEGTPEDKSEETETVKMEKGINSTVREIMGNEAAVKIIEKYAPGLTKDPRVDMAMGMKFKSIAPFTGGRLNKKVLASIDEELKKL